MTTVQLMPATGHEEPLSQRVARRLRGCMAENRISQSALAAAMHMPQQKVSRKLTGFTPLTLDEIELIAQILERPDEGPVEVEALLGTGSWADRGIGLCAIRDSNPEPADLSILTSLSFDAPVVEIRTYRPRRLKVKPHVRHLTAVSA